MPKFALSLWRHRWHNPGEDKHSPPKCVNGLSISDVKLKLGWIFRHFSELTTFDAHENFFVGSVAVNEVCSHVRIREMKRKSLISLRWWVRWVSRHLHPPASWLFVQVDIKGNSEAPHYWPFVRIIYRSVMRNAFACHGVIMYKEIEEYIWKQKHDIIKNAPLC